MTELAVSDVVTRDQIAVEHTWDLSTYFPSEDAWEEAFAGLPANLEQAVAFRGKLGESPDVMKQSLEAVFGVQEMLTRLVVYASLRRDEDTTNAGANGRYERAVMASIQAGEALAFLQPEILTLPDETLDGLIGAPELATYRHVLEDLKRCRAHVRSEEVEEVLAQMGDVARTASEAFGALDNADLTYGTVHDDDGKEITLTKARYGVLMESPNRAVRKEAFETLAAAYKRHGHTLASLHGSSVRKDVAAARIRGYVSAREEALFDDNVPDSVYDGLLQVVGDSTRVTERYLALRKRVLGIDELRRYDLRVPLAPELRTTYAYEDAVEVVLSGLEALGETYVNDLRKGFASRWVDVFETRGKRSGAYSWGAYGSAPVMLMNWNGTLSDVFTLAHEAGHSMHTFYAIAAQPFHLADYPIFLAEVASTVNEVLLTWHLLRTEAAADPLKRFSLLNRFAEGFDGTVTSQAMYAEFEHVTHRTAEEGRPLTLDFLNESFGSVIGRYTPGVVVDELASLGWSRVPHFYRAFYVYQYATGLSSAINIARAVRAEGEPARKRYLDMLAAGGSDYPMALLARAGVDLTTPDPIRIAFEEFDSVVTEMESLVDQGVLEQGERTAARS